MSRLFLVILVYLFTISCTGQLYISGKVLDRENRTVLKGASVYINNTTRGTISSDDGKFQLGPLSPGRYELVVSYVGYQPLLYTADLMNISLTVNFEVDRRETTLREVLVLTAENRAEFLGIFKKNVLGITSIAEKCRIKNTEDIQFTLGETKDDIGAFADNLLEIENPDLGYTIHFDLADFYYNKKKGATYFWGYSRYTDWAEQGEGKGKWVRKRRNVYEGSTVHFFRSLLKKELNQEGFTAYSMAGVSPPKADTSGKKRTYTVNIGNNLHAATRIMEDSMVKLYSDSVYRTYELLINNGWRIVYKKNTSLKTDIVQKMTFHGQPAYTTVSGMEVREKPVIISERGIMITPLNLAYTGIWSYERLANMLPGDYEPD